MPAKSQKNRRPVQHPNQVYLRQMNATLNRKLKSIRHHLVVQQSDLQQHLMKMIQDGKEQRMESKDSGKVLDSPRVHYKQLKVLLITPAMEREGSANSILIEQSLRHLVQHVNEIKTIQSVADHTTGQDLDLILVLDGEDALSNQNLEALRISSAKKAIWLSDQSDVKQMESIIPFFDYVLHSIRPTFPPIGIWGISHVMKYLFHRTPHCSVHRWWEENMNPMFISLGMHTLIAAYLILPLTRGYRIKECELKDRGGRGSVHLCPCNIRRSGKSYTTAPNLLFRTTHPLDVSWK